jgi:hypothetical protein
VNELGSQLDGELLFQIVESVDTAADAVAGFENNDGEAGLCELGCGHESGNSAAYHDHVGTIKF